MAKSKFKNPWGPGSKAYDRWMKPNPWERGASSNIPTKAQQNPIRRALPISRWIKQQYPTVVQFLRESMPSLVKNHTIINNLSTFSQLSPLEIKKILLAEDFAFLAKMGLEKKNWVWLEEGYSNLNRYLKARKIPFSELDRWQRLAVTDVGQGLTTPADDSSSMEAWTVIYINENRFHRLERILNETRSSLDIYLAAEKLRFIKLFLHEFTHYLQIVSGKKVVRDDFPYWDNGAEFEERVFGFTDVYVGRNRNGDPDYGTGYEGNIRYLDGASLGNKILEGITWNQFTFSTLKREATSQQQYKYLINSQVNGNPPE